MQSPTGPTGAYGANGATGPTGPGFTFEGMWNTTSTYEANQVVEHNGASWIANTTNTDSEPTFVNPDWSLMAAKGDTGPTGAQGATGPIGAQGPQGATG